ncbi:hypothetical protein ABES25_12575 [Bacillus gobiensis]|uniref:hypothetical protein n=1 Tax=Bacillus gobiensis TaxID=1441095 RepID=UPI003D1CCFF6
MNKWAYIIVNALLVVYFVKELIVSFLEKLSILNTIKEFVISVIVFNLMIFIFDIAINYFIKIINKREKRKKENSNLYQWLGEGPEWLDLYKDLKSIQEFDKGSLHGGLSITKREIKQKFPNINRLTSLKIYLETKVESPKLTTKLSAFQTIFVALITTTLVTLVNISNLNNLIFYSSAVVFIFGLLILIYLINSFSKEIERNKLLLKLVNLCIEEEKKR